MGSSCERSDGVVFGVGRGAGIVADIEVGMSRCSVNII